MVDSQGRSYSYFDLFKSGQVQYSAVGDSIRRGITKVEAGKFPSFEDLNSEKGRIIYSDKVRIHCRLLIDILIMYNMHVQCTFTTYIMCNCKYANLLL